MNTNECISSVHAALVRKAKAVNAAEGNNRMALEISAAIAQYGAMWASSFGNDGILDDAEEARLNAEFDAILTKWVPARDGVIVDKAWNGFKFCFVTVFDGVKAYLNRWFDLGLLCLAVCLCATGCKSFYENAGVHVRTGSVMAPIELSEPTSSVNVRALYTMDGIDMYAAKNCVVKMSYTNVYTNTYLGIVNTHGKQSSHVEIEPTMDNSEPGGDE